MTVLQLLDEIPHGAGPDSGSGWFSQIERSLEESPHEWTSAVAAIGALSDEHAWSLLSWVETAATEVVRTRSRATLTNAAFAMSLVLHSHLDRRDCSIVASLLRRGAALAGLDFAAAVADGCSRAGAMGLEAKALLLAAQDRTPSTHRETGAGSTFAFVRRTPDFDVEDLERWLEGEGR
jgi:hypothetical protein